MNFDLSVLISLINGYECQDATMEKKLQLVSHVHGQKVTDFDDDLFDSAVEHIVTSYPKVAQAAKLVNAIVPDEGRYKKLIDLFRKSHYIESLSALQPA